MISRYFTIQFDNGVDQDKCRKKLAGWFKRDEIPGILDYLVELVFHFLQVYLSTFNYTIRVSKENPKQSCAITEYEKSLITVWEGEFKKEKLIHEITHAVMYEFLKLRLPRTVDEHIACWVTEKLK